MRCEPDKIVEFPRAITEALENLGKKRKYIMTMLPAVEVAMAACAEFEQLEDKKYHLSVSCDTGMMQGVLLKLYPTSVRELTPILRWFARRGWRMAKSSEWSPNPEDYAPSHRRTWTLVSDGVSSENGVKLMAFFQDDEDNGDGKACSYVQVGVEPKPVFELRCGDRRVTDNELGEFVENGGK